MPIYHIQGWIQVTHTVDLCILAGSPAEAVDKYIQSCCKRGDLNNSALTATQIKEETHE